MNIPSADLHKCLVCQELNTNKLLVVKNLCAELCKTVPLALLRCGVCPVASKNTVYLLYIALLLLPAHVCLGFWDESPGPKDHTCRECELRRQTSSLMTKQEEILESIILKWVIFHRNMDTIVLKFGCTNSLYAFFMDTHTSEVMSCFSSFRLHTRLSPASCFIPCEPFSAI